MAHATALRPLVGRGAADLTFRPQHHVGAIPLDAVAVRPRWHGDLAATVVVWIIAAVGVLGTALLAPSVAGAHQGDGVFTLAEGARAGNASDVAMLPDSSIVGVNPFGAWVMPPDGRRAKIGGFGGSGVAATSDGSALAIQGELTESFPFEFAEHPPVGENRIVRWTPGVGVSVVAGTGKRGFGGDGGPATSALLRLFHSPPDAWAPLPEGIVARSDASFAFTDMGNGRIRAVDAAGLIRTIAGETTGALREPVGLAATPDGGYLVTEAGRRLRRVRPDATIESLTRLRTMPYDLVVSADGTVVLADGWALWRLPPGSPTPRPYLQPKRPTDTFDFAGRTIQAWGLALDRYGGLLAVGDRVLTYVPHGPTPWTLAELRSTHTSRRAVAAVVETTQPGTATLEVTRRGRTVARDVRPVPAGHSTLRAIGPIRSNWYRVRLRLDGDNGRSAADEVPIHGARTLTVKLARQLLGFSQGQEADEDIYYRLGRACRQFGRRRADCVIASTGDEQSSHAGVASLTLERTGIVFRRNYEWGPEGFQRHPRFIVGYRGEHAVQRLSPGRGGRWTW